MAIWEKEIAFNPNWLTYREGIYRSVLAYTKSDFEDVIEAIRSGELARRNILYCSFCPPPPIQTH